MDARSKGILATIASVILCGCPGLFLCVFGGLIAVGAPVNTELNGVSSSTQLPPAAGAALLCVALILILIPIAVAFFTLRKKPTAPIPPTNNEPLPPAS
jgi:hypothetical protein